MNDKSDDHVRQTFIHDNEPGVIDNDLLSKCIREQGPQGEGGRLYLEDGIVFEEVTSLRLEFHKILRIDHLWMMTDLVELHLCCNLIEKIENLDDLVKLEHLDLSFNNITVIENVNHLKKLEVFTVFSNKISKIQNLDGLDNLMIFSIGDNLISDMHDVLYLRRFHNLKSLNLAGNPCAESENFREYVMAYLPQLRYYEYRLVRDEQRAAACELFTTALARLEENEGLQREVEEARRLEAEKDALYSQSFVEQLDEHQLFDEMFAHDPDGIALLDIGEDAEELYQEFRKNTYDITQKIFLLGQGKHAERQKEIRQFERCVREGKHASEEKSQRIMDDFHEEKVIIALEIKALNEQFDSEDDIDVVELVAKKQQLVEDFNDMCRKNWFELMELESVLHEQLDEINGNFERNLNDHVNTFIEGAQEQFTILREQAQYYSEQIGEVANRFMVQWNLRGADVKIVMPPSLKAIMFDKDALINAISASHDFHLQVIDKREDKLISRVKNWASKMLEEIYDEENVRNRDRITEVNHFMDVQRDEFEDLDALEE